MFTITQITGNVFPPVPGLFGHRNICLPQVLVGLSACPTWQLFWVYSRCLFCSILCCKSDMEGRCSEGKATQRATSLAKSVRAWLFCPLILFVNYSRFPSAGQDSSLCAVTRSNCSLTYVGKELKWKSHSKP